jgi:hypothetical protein
VFSSRAAFPIPLAAQSALPPPLISLNIAFYLHTCISTMLAHHLQQQPAPLLMQSQLTRLPLITLRSTIKSTEDSSDVTADVTGDPDEAGFVQVIQGRGSDPDRARELMGQDSPVWAAFRPEILATVAVGHEGGAYTMAVYFTSEEEAREGERKEPPPELQAQMDELAALSVGEPEFFDLKQPWLYSPR